MSRRVIVTADDFGLSEAVNAAVEQAYRNGVLTTASLMVAGAAARDAVDRARRLPGLRVGLHLVVIEGAAAMPAAEIAGLVNEDGWFGMDQLKLGVAYFFRPGVRRQLRSEIRAQYAAFAATGLPLDHANAHKHMHLHPTVGRMLIQEGQRYGLAAVRVPAEPASVLQQCGERPGPGAAVLYRWTTLLRRQVRRAGLATADQVFGLHWTGGMTGERLLRLAPALPPGVSELYFHPATHADAAIQRLMPGYHHAGELAALVDPAVAAALPPRTTFAALPRAAG